MVIRRLYAPNQDAGLAIWQAGFNSRLHPLPYDLSSLLDYLRTKSMSQKLVKFAALLSRSHQSYLLNAMSICILLGYPRCPPVPSPLSQIMLFAIISQIFLNRQPQNLPHGTIVYIYTAYPDRKWHHNLFLLVTNCDNMRILKSYLNRDFSISVKPISQLL